MNTSLHWVSCCECAQFIPDAIGNGQGVGRCEVLEIYKEKLKAIAMNTQQYHRLLDQAEAELGIIPKLAKQPIRLLYPNVERICSKYRAA